MSADQESKSSIRKFLSHPLYVTILAGLIGIAVTVLTFLQSREYPRLTYFVHPVKAVLLQSGSSPKLTASYENKPIETDVTSAQIAIWNQGTQSIKSANILEPIVIYTENGAPILEATIRKTSRNVTQVSLGNEQSQTGRVNFSWKILEPDDGAIIQIIYAGTAQVRLRVDGVIEGQKQISEQIVAGGVKSSQEHYEDYRKLYRNFAVAMVALSILLVPLGACRLTVYIFGALGYEPVP